MATRTETLVRFLTAELAPSRERVRATGRIVVGCVVVTALGLGFHVPEVHWGIITIFTVSQSDAGASLKRGVQRVLGTIAGGVAGILIVTVFADQPWMRLPLLGVLAAAGTFLSRTTTSPYVGLLGALTGLLIASVAHGTDPSHALVTGLWRIVLIAAGVVIGTGVQVLLWPTDPEATLRTLLSDRLETAARMLRRLLESRAAPEPAAEHVLGQRGLLRQLDLLRSAEARHPSLRHHHVEQLALIAAAEHLFTAAAALERLAPPRLGDAARTRLAWMAGECERLAVAMRAGVAPEARRPAAAFSDEAVAAAGGTVLLGGIREMERALDQATMTLASGPPAAPASLVAVHFDVPEDGSFFTPACSMRNTAELAFACKAGIAVTILEILVNGLVWPGISTAIWTSLLVAQSSVGAIVQKSMLRLAGAAVGGLMGLIASVLVMPNGETLASMLVTVAVGSTVAAWLNTGSPRIAYAGMQIGLAFGLTIIDAFGPVVNLTVPRDRLIGIFLGIAVTGIVFAVSGHRLARDGLRGALAKALRVLADLARVGTGAGAQATPDTGPVMGRRWAVYTALTQALGLHDEAGYEAGAHRPEVVALRGGILAATNRALGVMLALLAVVRHRLAVELHPDAEMRSGVHRLAVGIVETLEALADRLDGRPRREPPDLSALLAQVESREAGEAAIHLHARIALYRALVGALAALARDVEALQSSVCDVSVA